MKKNKLFYVLPAMLLLVTLTSATTAFADRKGGSDDFKEGREKGIMVGMLRGMDMRMDDNKKEAKLDGSSLEVNIKDNGQVLVRGAKVSAVSGNMITATTAWGAMTLNWNVNVLSSTNIVRKFGSASSISEVKVGDIVSFTGSITSGSNSAMVVDAKVIKNWSVQKQNVRSKVEGVVKSISSTTLPTTLVVTAEGKDYTVNIGATTSLVSDAWTALNLSSFAVGNKVTAYGVVNDTNLSVSATVLKNKSI